MIQTDTVDLRGLISMLRRQGRLIVLSVAILVGLALLYLFNATPIYTSSALIYVDPSKKDLLADAPFSSMSGAAENAKIESEVEILRSNRVLFATMDRLNLIQSPEFGPSLSRLDQIKIALGIDVPSPHDPSVLVATTSQRLGEAVQIRRKGLTYLISVSAQSADPQTAADIANTMVEVYIAQQVASKTEAALASRDVLQAQIDTAKAQLSQSEANFDTFIIDNLARLSSEVGTERFATLQQQFKQAREGTLQTQAQLQTAQAALDGGEWDQLTTTLSDAALSALDRQRRQIEQRLNATQRGSDAEIDLRASLAQIQIQMEEQAGQVVTTLQRNLSTKQEKLNELQGALRSEVMQGDLSPETLATIFELQQESDIAQRQYSTLLSRLRDIEAQALVQVADSRVVSEAIAPIYPSAPHKKLILGMAFTLAVGIGLGMAVLNEYVIGGVTALSQLRNIVPGPVVGTLPKVTLMDDQLSVADLIVDEPMSLFSEALRRTRAHVDQGLRSTPSSCIVMMVTSANLGEGKSSLSLSLARTYAAAGKRVLLIDADLRKPALHRHIGFKPDEGFLEYLKDPTEKVGVERTFYVADPRSQTGIILGREQAELPTDQLLQTEAFSNLLASARQSMDVVIIDTPPLLPVVDARYIAPLVDAILLTVRYGETSQSDVRDAYAQINDAKAPDTPVFTILNADETKTAYKGYYGADTAS
ncbi:GumC family protein [Celeribacter sp.]|uniref:GumC family protein n=1 Tax=Celeribacter sp. TaxID=1890673 RepID=UPI003A944B75